MLNTNNTLTADASCRLESGAEKTDFEQAQASEKSTCNPVKPEIEVISNQGRMPRPWIFWELLRISKKPFKRGYACQHDRPEVFTYYAF